MIELLVTIAVIGILVALLLPAVQMVREAARRTSCSNNIRQIGLAMMNHESAWGRLPAGWSAADSSSPAAGPGWGWATHILSEVEQQNLSDRIDWKVSVDDPQHQDLLQQVIPVFLCASDPAENLLDLDEEVLGGHGHRPAPGSPALVQGHGAHWISRSNYSGVFGSNEIEDDPMNGNGLFFGNSHIHLRDIHDGMSNTLLVGERRNDYATLSWAGVFPDVEESFARVVGAADHPPNDRQGHFEDFRSYHPQGANFVFADGSTWLLGDSIDAAVFQALSTRDGSETVNLEQ